MTFRGQSSLEQNRHGVLTLGCPEMPRRIQSELLLLLDFGEIGGAGEQRCCEVGQLGPPGMPLYDAAPVDSQ